MAASPNDSGLADKSDASSNSADGLRVSILKALQLSSPSEAVRKPSAEVETKASPSLEVETKSPPSPGVETKSPPSPRTVDGETTFGVTEDDHKEDGSDGVMAPRVPSPITVGGETTFDVVAPPNDGNAILFSHMDNTPRA
jgi:hypothetical protein